MTLLRAEAAFTPAAPRTGSAALIEKREAPRLERGGALDALRFLASAFIVLFHYGDEAPIPLAQLSSVFDRGYLATDFFLMLSGYVLGRVYGPRLDRGQVRPGEFLRRRVQRVWPLHLAALGALVGLVLASHLIGHPLRHAGAYTWSSLPAQVFLVQVWFGGGSLGWNQPSWTLSALLVCYAVFPWLWRGVRGMGATTSLVLSGGAVAVSVWLLRTRWGLDFFDLPFRLGIWRALPLFGIGAALARLRLSPPPSAVLRATLALAAAAGLAALQTLPRTDALDGLSMALIALAIFAAGARPPRAPSALLRGAADLSFALFLTHHLAGALWFAGLHAVRAASNPPPWEAWALWIGGLVFALVVAAAFARLDERLQSGLAAVESRLRGSGPLAERA